MKDTYQEWHAEVDTPLRRVECRVTMVDRNHAWVNALDGAPFAIVPSKPGYPVCMSDSAVIEKDALINLRLVTIEYEVSDLGLDDCADFYDTRESIIAGTRGR